MSTVTLTRTPTNDYQVNIPKEVFDPLGFKGVTSFGFIRYNNRLELIPIYPIRSLRGTLKGIDTTIEREEEDRL